jgi:Family of unknown function (DUF5719)
MRTARPGPARGQALFAVGVAIVTGLALLGLSRAGPASPSPIGPVPAASGAWICPHGGGEGWTVALFLANPGDRPVTARLTPLQNDRAGQPTSVEVPAGATVRVDDVADERSSATYVEYFDGWIAAGWVLVGEGDQPGTAAEPCAPEPARRWYLPDGNTGLREDAYVIVANPFDVRAVLDAIIYTPDRAPIRDSAWTDLTIAPHRSLALHLNAKVEGEEAAAVELDVSVGRVAAASLGVTDKTRLRSALGTTGLAGSVLLPIMKGSERADLVVLSTADRSMRFGATLLGTEAPRPAGGLTEQEEPPASARSYPVTLEGGPGGVETFSVEEVPIAAALRAPGPSGDRGSTGGTTRPWPAWTVLPATAIGPSKPGLVLLNAGDDAVVAHVESLAREGGTAAAPVDVEVPPHGAAAVPASFLEAAPGSGVLVRADGPIAALAASTSIGKDATDTFALSMGVAVPRRL